MAPLARGLPSGYVSDLNLKEGSILENAVLHNNLTDPAYSLGFLQ